jgi:hypothetical protein
MSTIAVKVTVVFRCVSFGCIIICLIVAAPRSSSFWRQESLELSGLLELLAYVAHCHSGLTIIRVIRIIKVFGLAWLCVGAARIIVLARFVVLPSAVRMLVY